MALHLHRADRTDLLADGLGALLADSPARPVRRGTGAGVRPRDGALAEPAALARPRAAATARTGSAPGVTFRHPRSLIAEITGTDDDDPWAPDAMVWPLLDVIDGCLDEPWCRTLATHLGHFERRRREASCARAGATRWHAASPACSPPTPGNARSCSSTGSTADTDDLDDDLRWQPALCGARCSTASTPTRLTSGTRIPLPGCGNRRPTCRSGCRCSGTPGCRSPRSNCSTRWPPITICTCGCRIPVTTCGPRCAASRRRAPPRGHQPSRRRPPAAGHARPRPARAAARPARGPADRRIPRRRRPTRHTARLAAVRHRRQRRPSRAAGALHTDDRSVQVHSCHGPARQIDVLREVLLGLLADDPTLEPRDILVMCPDIETYAPLIVAGFGLGDVVAGAHPAHRLRVKLADRALTQTNPLLGVARQLLGLAGGRATASEVLNLAEAAPVRRPVRVLRRRPRRDRRLGARGQHPLGLRRDAPPSLRRRLRAEHLAFRHRPGARRGRDVRRLAGLAGAPRCRSTTSAATASNSPAASPSTSSGYMRVVESLSGHAAARRTG